MVQSVVYVKPDTPVLKAMEMLVSHNISGIPVVKIDMTLSSHYDRERHPDIKY